MDILNAINDLLWTYLLIGALLVMAIYFTIATRGVQFRMMGEMLRLLARSGQKHDDSRDANVDDHHKVSSFQAFAVSIASRVGTGNLAGVATAIAIGGPGAVFWMWVIALLGSANAFIESTLAQLYKIKGSTSFMGGPAYYIQKGIGKRWWAVTFAILITITFGLAFNSVQANTISCATAAFGCPTWIVGIVLTALSLLIIWGGIQRISRFSEVIVPIMAILYIILALVILIINIREIPRVVVMIVENAFGVREVMGGGMGMALLMGIKRGLFSNEAGEGSAPNVAATASVSHPVKQGLIQTLAVFTDTLIICTCTAVIILLSDCFNSGASGIALTQQALDSEIGMGLGSIFVAIAIFFFAFTSIVANYYYGETNLRFISRRPWLITLYRLCVGAMVMIGSISTLDFVWAFADLTMGLMTICNLAAIAVLGRYAIICLADYEKQKVRGYDPMYHSRTIPSIASQTECWGDGSGGD
ncbi:MAG: alanine:cation symporter family protein [Bacteroidales bacterium]|nr:alanine:cation symporter family protein [Bacteroidales bacterium]